MTTSLQKKQRSIGPWFVLLWVTLAAGSIAWGLDSSVPVLVPSIESPWWQIAGNPDVGKYTSNDQQPVDFGIWQAADGTWQLWSCIRNTKYPGKTRFFYRWQSPSFTSPDWTPKGIAMEADVSVGEIEGGLQAPYVMKYQGEYLMFYGTWRDIALAKSKDGKTFQRRLMPSGKAGMFDDDHFEGTRDPMVLRFGNQFHLYYTAALKTTKQGADYVRTSTDLVHWSPSKMVAFGGAAGTGGSSAECPFVYFHKPSGYYYLFRTQEYGEHAKTSVYRSTDPTNFGVNDDRFLVETLPIAAPEIVESNGWLYIVSLLPSLKGIQVAKLTFVPKP